MTAIPPMIYQTYRRLMPSTACQVAALVSVWALHTIAQPASTPLLSASDAAAVKTGGPKIQFAETTYDFGKVDSGTLVKHDFIFTNTGDQALEITGVRPGCGCTTAGDWDKHVEPGTTGKVPLQFNSAGYSGTVLKTTTVTCNDAAQ